MTSTTCFPEAQGPSFIADAGQQDRRWDTSAWLRNWATCCTGARKHRNGHAYSTNTIAPEGMGGFAHGVTGIGWALTRLARATDSARHEQLAQEAFAFEDALFDEQEQNWRDLRMLENSKTAAAWCHGAGGIGLAHPNLDPTLTHASTGQLVRGPLQQPGGWEWAGIIRMSWRYRAGNC